MGNRMGFRAGLLVVALLWQGVAAVAQEKPLLIVGFDSVYEGAFRYAYEKNRSYTLTAGLTVEDFFDSYKGFRLKVAEAKRQGYDTLEALRSEYDKYMRFQLSSRLLDSAEREEQYRAAHARMQREVAASHILIRVEEQGDTLAAYNRIMELRRRIKAGEDFGVLARQHSDDPSAGQNGGYLGYFGAFSMVPPFERVAYGTPVDSISQPVRTTFGYHLVRVHGVRPSRGKMRVAHIMKVVEPDASQAQRDALRRSLDSIRDRIGQGVEFSVAAVSESEDKGAAQQGGILPWITPERFPAAFVDACFALTQDGEVSQVVQSPFGYHIIQRIAHQPVPSYEEAKEQIRSHFAREGMILEGEYALRNALQRRVKMTLNRQAIALHCEQTLNGNGMPDSVGRQVLMECVGASLTGFDMPDWGRVPGGGDSLQGQPAYFQALQQAVDGLVERAAIRSVVSEYPDLGYMMGEFQDGLLLFEISDRELWNRPMPDSATLRQVYKRHRKALVYPVCYEVDHFTSPSDTVLLRLRGALARGVPRQGWDSAGNFAVEVRRCGEDDPLLAGRADSAGSWDGNLSPVVRSNAGGYALVRVIRQQHNAPKTFEEAKGELYALHQSDLEAQWLKRLAKVHRVWVNRARLRALKAYYAQ